MNGKYLVSAVLFLAAAVMMSAAYVAAGTAAASRSSYSTIDSYLGPGECLPALAAAVGGVVTFVLAGQRGGPK